MYFWSVPQFSGVANMPVSHTILHYVVCVLIGDVLVSWSALLFANKSNHWECNDLKFILRSSFCHLTPIGALLAQQLCV